MFLVLKREIHVTIYIYIYTWIDFPLNSSFLFLTTWILYINLNTILNGTSSFHTHPDPFMCEYNKTCIHVIVDARKIFVLT